MDSARDKCSPLQRHSINMQSELDNFIMFPLPVLGFDTYEYAEYDVLFVQFSILLQFKRKHATDKRTCVQKYSI